MVTNFDTENIINQSKKAPCKHRTVIKLFTYTQNKLHIQIHTYKHTQVHSGYEDDMHLLLQLWIDRMGSTHHQ